MISMQTMRPVTKYPLQIVKRGDPKTVFQECLTRLQIVRSQELRDRLCNATLDIYRTNPTEARLWAREWQRAWRERRIEL